MGSLRSTMQRCVDTWCAQPPSTYGEYSVARLEEFYHYQTHTPTWRVLVVCATTPLLAIVMIILTDALPLQDPARGVRYSYLLWLRAFISVFCVVGASLLQLRFVIPNLKVSILEVLGLSAISAIAGVLTEILLAIAIGYPVPFGLVLGTGPTFGVLVAGIILPRRALLQSVPSLRQQLKDFVIMWICQISLTVIYPVYAYVFSSLPSRAQTAFVLLLPLIKIVHKRWFYHSLHDADDLKPEIAVFNVEVFNALFVAVCMQSSRSIYTTIMIMAIDTLQVLYATRSVMQQLTTVNELLDKSRLEDAGENRWENAVRAAVTALTEDEPLRKTLTGRRSHFEDAAARNRSGTWSPVSGLVSISVYPAPPENPIIGVNRLTHNSTGAHVHPEPAAVNRTATLTDLERNQLVKKTLHLLFITEFFVLVEYTEVIIPIIYST